MDDGITGGSPLKSFLKALQQSGGDETRGVELQQGLLNKQHDAIRRDDEKGIEDYLKVSASLDGNEVRRYENIFGIFKRVVFPPAEAEILEAAKKKPVDDSSKLLSLLGSLDKKGSNIQQPNSRGDDGGLSLLELSAIGSHLMRLFPAIGGVIAAVGTTAAGLAGLGKKFFSKGPKPPPLPKGPKPMRTVGPKGPKPKPKFQKPVIDVKGTKVKPVIKPGAGGKAGAKVAAKLIGGSLVRALGPLGWMYTAAEVGAFFGKKADEAGIHPLANMLEKKYRAEDARRNKEEDELAKTRVSKALSEQERIFGKDNVQADNSGKGGTASGIGAEIFAKGMGTRGVTEQLEKLDLNKDKELESKTQSFHTERSKESDLVKRLREMEQRKKEEQDSPWAAWFAGEEKELKELKAAVAAQKEKRVEAQKAVVDRAVAVKAEEKAPQVKETTNTPLVKQVDKAVQQTQDNIKSNTAIIAENTAKMVDAFTGISFPVAPKVIETSPPTTPQVKQLKSSPKNTDDQLPQGERDTSGNLLPPKNTTPSIKSYDSSVSNDLLTAASQTPVGTPEDIKNQFKAPKTPQAKQIAKSGTMGFDGPAGPRAYYEKGLGYHTATIQPDGSVRRVALPPEQQLVYQELHQRAAEEILQTKQAPTPQAKQVPKYSSVEKPKYPKFRHEARIIPEEFFDDKAAEDAFEKLEDDWLTYVGVANTNKNHWAVYNRKLKEFIKRHPVWGEELDTSHLQQTSLTPQVKQIQTQQALAPEQRAVFARQFEQQAATLPAVKGPLRKPNKDRQQLLQQAVKLRDVENYDAYTKVTSKGETQVLTKPTQVLKDIKQYVAEVNSGTSPQTPQAKQIARQPSDIVISQTAKQTISKEEIEAIVLLIKQHEEEAAEELEDFGDDWESRISARKHKDEANQLRNRLKQTPVKAAALNQARKALSLPTVSQTPQAKQIQSKKLSDRTDAQRAGNGQVKRLPPYKQRKETEYWQQRERLFGPGKADASYSRKIKIQDHKHQMDMNGVHGGDFIQGKLQAKQISKQGQVPSLKKAEVELPASYHLIPGKAVKFGGKEYGVDTPEYKAAAGVETRVKQARMSRLNKHVSTSPVVTSIQSKLKPEVKPRSRVANVYNASGFYSPYKGRRSPSSVGSREANKTPGAVQPWQKTYSVSKDISQYATNNIYKQEASKSDTGIATMSGLLNKHYTEIKDINAQLYIAAIDQVELLRIIANNTSTNGGAGGTTIVQAQQTPRAKRAKSINIRDNFLTS